MVVFVFLLRLLIRRTRWGMRVKEGLCLLMALSIRATAGSQSRCDCLEG